MLLLFAIGLSSRTIPHVLPSWYVAYAGDFLWAMLIFFLFCVILRLKNIQAFYLALVTTYIIEITQLFHPAWLEALRSVKVFALILGYTFLWSDIVAYTLGISLGALIDRLIINRIPMKAQQNTNADVRLTNNNDTYEKISSI